VLGIGPQQYSAYEEAATPVDESRTVKVQFMSTNQSNMPWIFEPAQFEVEVHPGERAEVAYYAKNNTSRDMVAQAIPSVVPINAVDYLHKIECYEIGVLRRSGTSGKYWNTYSLLLGV
jgi:cytochrome c oxidase assembly protein subunit 11